MKRISAIILAIVMVFTLVSVASCKGNEQVVRVTLFVTDSETIVRNHTVGHDDLPTPTNGDMEFKGWYYDKAYTKEFDPDKEDNNQIVYAKWDKTSVEQPTTDKVTLTLNPSYTGATPSTFEIDKNSTFTLPTSTRAGYKFEGWFTQPVGGIQWSDSLPVSVDTTLYAHWTQNNGDNNNGDDDPDPQPATHTHDFGDNYFMYVKCSVEGCNEVGRKTSTNPFRNDFKYTYTQTDRAALDNVYNTLSTQIKNGTTNVNAIDEKIEELESMMSEIEYQYQVATVLYSVNYDDAWETNTTFIGEAYNDCFKYYYTLFGLINDSQYGTEYFSNWSADDKEYVLEQAAVYSASEDNLQTIADNLATEYNNKLYELYNSESDEINWSPLYEIYAKYVQANNNIAAQYGNKYDNYMDYAYDKEYGREYTPADVATMRNYVKTVIAPILIDLYSKYSQMPDFGSYDNNDNFVFTSGLEDDYDLYDALSFESLFTLDEGYEEYTYAATNYIGNYFKYLNSNAGGKEINFYKAANDLFKNGNYFTSSDGEEGAYTYYIVDKKTPIMYFDDSYDWQYGYSYSSAFTFVHEFGHYYADIYTNGGNFSMDHAETHSQGNEMLFLAWLSKNCPTGTEFGYKVLEIEQLANILNTVVQSTIVDEFEQAVYSNTYGDGEFKNGIATSQYAELYKAIVDSYGEGMSDILGDEYWMYVVVDSSAYYISYAMSALPSVEIFVKAMTGDINSARDTYFKLFTYADRNGETTYSAALAYAGLANPFEKAMYDNISAYFANYTV